MAVTKKKLFEGSLDCDNKDTLVNLTDDIKNYDFLYFIFNCLDNNGKLSDQDAFVVFPTDVILDSIKSSRILSFTLDGTALQNYKIKPNDLTNAIILNIATLSGSSYRRLASITGLKF